ncbi:MAG: excinuclease ABC subunit UvrC [Candidatus Nanoarchaeia archaeon]|jgi:excinuclease ABC subunit C
MIDLSSLPNKPGSYQFKDKNNKIIYVGKAKNLKKRVGNYFMSKGLDEKTKALVKNIDSVDYIVTNNEIEALILENNLIKKLEPYYNISLKDSKTYAFIKITDDEFPRFVVLRERQKGENVFGPFVLASDRKNILEFINKSFKLRTCNRLPKKECLRFQIGLCSAPCINNISRKDYLNSVNKAKKVLLGKNDELITLLRNEVRKCSISQDFEKAIIIREQLKAIIYLNEKQIIQRDKKNNENFIDYLVDDSAVYIMVFKVNNGLVSEKEEFEFSYSPDFFSQFIFQYYSENIVPKEIVLRENVEKVLLDFLKTKNCKVKIILPKSRDKLKMLDLVKKNIAEKFLKSKNALLELKDFINLENVPHIIEGFDISHLSGTDTTASMVQFKNGEPNKNEYRKFKIKTLIDEIDDFKAMKEVVLRRYKRLLLENKPLPDLMLIDGGMGQLSSARKALKELNINIPIISLAKKFEELWLPNRASPLLLNKKSEALKLLQRVRDEAHRFAINYNKNLRSKRLK